MVLEVLGPVQGVFHTQAVEVVVPEVILVKMGIAHLAPLLGAFMGAGVVVSIVIYPVAMGALE